MTDVLQELRDKVAARANPRERDFEILQPATQGARYARVADDALRAYRGSLDAAKALHEALLPGWGFRVAADDCCEGCVTAMDISGASHSVAYAQDANIASAWLLAILDALIQGNKADG